MNGCPIWHAFCLTHRPPRFNIVTQAKQPSHWCLRFNLFMFKMDCVLFNALKSIYFILQGCFIIDTLRFFTLKSHVFISMETFIHIVRLTQSSNYKSRCGEAQRPCSNCRKNMSSKEEKSFSIFKMLYWKYINSRPCEPPSSFLLQ